MLCVPRRSRSTGQSKKVMSVPGEAFAVRVEQMVGAHIVLVDRLLHEPQAERLGVEGVIARARPP